jgi:folate-binding Fe-S cluster repair protein YgfZ
VVRLTLDGSSPEPGIPVLGGDRPLGTMGSTAGGRGLALLRIDRVADALDAGLPLTAGGLAIRLTDPNDVRTPPKQTVA